VTVRYLLDQQNAVAQMTCTYMRQCDMLRQFDYGTIGWRERDEQLKKFQKEFDEWWNKYAVAVCEEVTET